MRFRPAALLAILIGSLLCVINYAGVIAGMVAPPPGYQATHYILNLDVPQYLTWAELAKTHWLLPDYHAPWQTEPALFQPMLQIVGRSGLPIWAAYYLLQIVMCWIAAFALIQAALVFLRTRRAIVYAALVVVCALPLKLYGWAVAKALALPIVVQALLGLGVVEYAYDSADGLLRGGLSNSFTLTFGTAITLFAFTALARFVVDRRRRYYIALVACVFLDGFFHPFEIFLITVAAVWPLLKIGKRMECAGLFCAAGAGMLPYVIQSARSAWVRDASDLAQWKMGSPAWVLLVFGLPACMVCWLMLMRFRVERSEDEILQSWFIAAALLPMIPAIPGSMHLFDGFAYCTGFLLVRKAQQDRLISRLFREKPRPMRIALAAWAAISVLVIGVLYAQVWKDGKSANPELFLSTVAPREQFAMLGWMKANLPHDGLVLAPEQIAPWVATIPMPSLASHDLFSITYQAQQQLAQRFYKGEDLRRDLIDGFGVRYVIAPRDAPIVLGPGKLIHQENALRLYEIPGECMKPYPGAEKLTGAQPRNGFRRWVVSMMAALEHRRA
ncbi:MAG TPA: hypothetical protein VK419_09185 [Bryobacteraceae bacterium]|nr:hypothetical protein [Bryobacteraceae bacterium]